jgi:hypothetical protein
MTFSKSCQVELFTFPTIVKFLVIYKDLRPGTPAELMPCANKSKHSVIMRTSEFGQRRSIKFRFCDFHFNYLREKYENEGLYGYAGEEMPFFKFRWNRL